MSTVLREREGGVMLLRLNRPDRLNALNREMRLELASALHEANSDSAVKCIVLTGSGKGFCSGADLDGIEEDLSADLSATFHPILREIRLGPKIVISAVGGVAAGAGISIAVAADLRYCSPAARFVTAFHKLGLAPDTGLTFLLPRLVGAAGSMEMLLAGGEFGAQWAASTGLFTVADDPLAEAMSKAALLADGPTLSYQRSKTLLNESVFSGIGEFLASEAEAQGFLGRSADFSEAKAAFAGKRKPVYRGQ